MLNILQIEDRLKDMSEDVVKRMVTEPNSTVPPFLATNELNRRDRMRKEFQMRQAQDMPTVAEQLVTGAGMPNESMSQMAMNMAPKSDIAGNTGLEAMMPKATMPETEEDEVMLMEDEDPMGMSFGGLINSRLAGISRMAAPMARDVLSTSQEPMGMSRGLSGFGSDIMNRVGDKSRGDVDNFLGEVEGMAEDRFDIDLSPEQRQIGMSGKGMSPVRPSIAQKMMSNISLPQPMYRREGGLASMSNGGYIERLLTGIPNYLGNKMFGIGSTDEDEVDADSVDYDDRITRMTRTGTDNQSFDETVDTDTKTPPPPATTKAGPSAFDNILSMIQEDRESAKEQRDRDRYLALMQFGLNLAKRGQLEDTGEGLKTLAMSNKAYQDQLGKLRALDVNALLTKEGIAGRERAAGITAQAALERALAKTGLTEEDILQSISRQQKNIVDIENQLYGTEGLTSSLPTELRASKEVDLKKARERLYYLEGELEKRRASNVIKVD